jgi:hypothetical protein
MDSSSESVISGVNDFSSANDNHEPSNYDSKKNMEMKKCNQISQCGTVMKRLVSEGGSEHVVKLLRDEMIKLLEQSSSHKDAVVATSPMLCEKDNEYNLGKEEKSAPKKKASTTAGGTVAMLKSEINTAFHIQKNRNQDDIIVVACKHVLRIANSLKGSSRIVKVAMKEDLVFRQKVFDQAYTEGGGDGYRFNRVTVSGIEKCNDRPHTLVKYVE